jgi:uncharacterized delta-60 repeat protein
MSRQFALAVLVASSLSLVPASAASRPGRVVFPGGGVVAGSAVALPGGAMVFLAGRGSGQRAVQLRPDGSLDAAFGTEGLARVTVRGSGFGASGLLRQPDGRLLVIGTTTVDHTSRLALRRLTARGGPDPTFGGGGLATTPLRVGCRCMAVALAPDGAIVATGTVNGARNSGVGWAAIRLTAGGASDASFAGGLARLPVKVSFGTGADGVAVTPAGTVLLLGHDDRSALLTSLTAAGAVNPAFNGGAPVRIPGRYTAQMVMRPSGEIDVLGDRELVRLSAAGAFDGRFGGDGRVAIKPALDDAIVVTPGGDTLVYSGTEESLPRSSPRLRVQRVDTAGVVRTAVPRTPFGGGLTSRIGTGPFVQEDLNSFAPAQLLARPDGTLVALGSVVVGRYRNDGTDTRGFAALAAFTANLAPDRSFGGRRRPPTLQVRVVTQRAADAARRGTIRLVVTASAAGFATVRLRDRGGHLLAQDDVPVQDAGSETMAAIPVTASGQRTLSRGALAVRIAFRFRDLLAVTSAGAQRGRLR